MKFCFYSLGCKVNRCETQALSQLAEERGHEIVDVGADVCIINTCTVTSVSDHKNIRAFHRAKKENPQAVIAAIGCFSQMDPQKVQLQPEIDLICGTGDRISILDRCETAAALKQPEANFTPAAPPRAFEPLPAGIPLGRTRALLKIQDGCDNYCTYCIIPYARGHVRSMPPAEVLRQVDALHAQGVHEIVLTGIEISSYGTDLHPKTDLTTLIERVCTSVPTVRVRLSSLEPRTASEDFCTRLSVFPNLMRHFHLSLQSGSDSVLARMKRRYTTAEYYEAVQRIRAAFPHASITTDLIVGFPEESDAEFQQTISFIDQCAFADIHVFSYSPRKGTVAAAMSGQISPQVKKQRAEQVKAAAKAMGRRFLDSFIGLELDILLEHPSADSIWLGHAPFHFQIAVQTPNGEKNRMMRARVTERTGNSLTGKEI